MSDTITQTRLALRLDGYMGDFNRKSLTKGNLPRVEWDTVWKAANLARSNNALTPEIVDDVRVVVNKL